MKDEMKLCMGVFRNMAGDQTLRKERKPINIGDHFQSNLSNAKSFERAMLMPSWEFVDAE